MTQKTKKQVFGTLEWASYNENYISGCAHDCRYCYSKEMAIRFKRKKASTWQDEKINKNKLSGNAKKYDGKVMFPSSHDITPTNLDSSIFYLEKLLSVDNDILLVTKPHLKVIERICEDLEIYRNKILFRFTIGALDSKILKFWEPHAPAFDERFRSVVFAAESGFKTSISVEPMLDDVDNTIKLVERLLPYVADSIWLGKPNFLLRRLKINSEDNPKVIAKAKQLENWFADSEINRLYQRFKTNKKVKWKESIKKVIDLPISTQKGLDM